MGAGERRAEGVLLSGFFVNWGNAAVSGNSRGCASITDMEGRARYQSTNKGWACPAPSERSTEQVMCQAMATQQVLPACPIRTLYPFMH